MSAYTYETVQSAVTAPGVRTITLNRPQALNAMNLQLILDVARAFDDANACPDTRAIVFTGAGRAFCAGDDRNEHVHPETEQEARRLVDAIQAATVAIMFGAKPVVGAINGWAVGGGFEWAINCDFPIWGESARGFFPEVSLNLLGVAWRVAADDDLQRQAQQVASQLAALPPLACRAMKRVLNQATAGGLKTALELETEATVAGFMDPETTRLLKSF